MKQVLRFNKVIKRIVFTGDLILLNGTFLSLYTLLGSKFFADPFIHSLPQVLVLLNLCYLVSNMSSGIILHRCVVRPEQIVWRALRNSAGHALFFSCALTFGNFGILSARFFLLFYIAFTLLLVCYRLLFRKILKSYRKHGGNSRSIILVGSNSNIIELYHQMTDDVTSGFRVIGYFDDQPGSRFPEKVNYLGKPGKIVDRLKQGGVEQVYCCLPSARSEEILPIIDYCENHLIRFFSVPNVRSYLKRRMYFELLGNVPVLCIRQEPLSFAENRFRKRVFDIAFSLLFLCTLFPIIYVIVGLTIKITSPGWAARLGFAFSSPTSAVRTSISSRLSTPIPVLAEMGHTMVSPPQSSHTRPYSVSCCLMRSGFASGLSILLMATMMGIPAALAWLMDSTVWGMMPSSAATTRMAMSVTMAPRARMEVKASWPGVSRKVMGLPLICT